MVSGAESALAASLVQHGSGSFNPFLPGWIILLPFLGFLVNGAVAWWAPDRRRLVSVVGPAVIGLAFVLATVNFIGLVTADAVEPVIRSYWSWLAVGDLQVAAALQIDRLSILMALVVTSVSFVIHIYSIGYMAEDPGYARYFAYLNLFVFFMLVLVLAANLPVTFVGWEGVGLCSYLLIGFWFTDRDKAEAGQKAFIVNRIGDFGFLVGMFVLFVYVGTLDYVRVFEFAPRAFEYGGAAVTLATLMLFLGCVGKSAQIPLHIWLPDAMHGPTPVSALIHAATMVTAGVYLVARASVLFALAPVTMQTVAIVGGLTALFAATIALQQFDIKRVIAYSTISQLGYMFLAVGVGAFTAGIFHLATHAFFKALLFLVSGAVIHAMHHALHHAGEATDEATTQDMRNMGGLRQHLPVSYWTAWAGALALAGIFPFAGFFSKDEIIWYTGAYGHTVLWAMAIVAALLTAAYIARWMVMVFHGENRTPATARGRFHEVSRVMTIPLVVLAVGALASGWINVPEALPVLPAVAWLHDFLHPTFAGAEAVLHAHAGEPAHAAPVGGGEGTWALISVGLAAALILVTLRALGRKRYAPAAEAAEPTGVAGVLYRKWYVDELVDLVVVRPLHAISRLSWRVIDQGIIDGLLVNGAGYVTRFAGWVISRFQTGYVGTYVVAIVLGVLIILGAVAL
jgi:NADH-quinone oxidoreductase subunit L